MLTPAPDQDQIRLYQGLSAFDSRLILGGGCADGGNIGLYESLCLGLPVHSRGSRFLAPIIVKGMASGNQYPHGGYSENLDLQSNPTIMALIRLAF